LILRRQTGWAICGEAENGLEALEKERGLKPDLIILDISMPDKDGLEVIAELRGTNSTAKILAFSMHDSEDLITALKAAGARGHVVKSHAARDLVKAIQTIVDGGDFFGGPLLTKPEGLERRKKKLPIFRLDALPALA
jgi:two-component system, NarL family, nitrate/nitrite response regulator NarL